MKVLIDTNVLLSSYFFGGIISDTIGKLKLMDDVFITDYSLKEISDKLLNKYGNTKQNW
jgi:predicted nucleic acid-binding protein